MRLALLMLAACGRSGFDRVAADGAVDAVLVPDVAPAAPTLVMMAGGSTTATNSNELAIAVPQTAQGDLIVVAFTSHDDKPVTSISDDAGNTYVSANVRAHQAATASELWYATQAAPTTSIQIAMSATSSFDAFVMEFDGVRGAPAKTNQACLQYPPAIVTAPITTSVPDELIVTATMFAFPLFVSAMDPPFVGLPPITGNDAGYLVAHDVGTYASAFQIDSGQGMDAMICASSISWLPQR